VYRRGKNKFGMYHHFCGRHPDAKLVIEDDGVIAQCELCGMHAVNMQTHQQTKTCATWRERQKHQELQDKQAVALEVDFFVYGKKLEQMREF